MKNEIEYIDLVNNTEKTPLKPIVLTHCLQNDRIRISDGKWVYFFYESNIVDKAVTKSVIRLSKITLIGVSYDLISIVYNNGENNIFLGHWNDGVL